MDLIKPDWINRGYATATDLLQYQNAIDNELLKLLNSKIAVQRSVAATLLGQRKSEKAVNPLCDALKKEKALYSKIAISEALGNIGIASVNALIGLFGKIGKNQYKTLPEKPFEKWNYPLPRDIAARTIVRVRESAIEPIINSISTMKREALSEALDSIGFISFYCENKMDVKVVLNLLDVYSKDDLIIWKIMSCLQSFPSRETIEVLEQYLLKHKQPAVRWEAARSLGQICKSESESLVLGFSDNNQYVRDMCKSSHTRILLRKSKI